MLEMVQRILIIRLGSLGDILLTTPILRLLRDHCPAARIDFLLKAPYQDLLRAHPCVDRLHLFQANQSLGTTLSTLRQTRYDLVLDLHRTWRSFFLYRGVSARYRLAYGKRTLRRALLAHLHWNTLRPMTPVPELYAAPLRRMGITAPVPAMEMHLEAESLRTIQRLLVRTFPAGVARPLLAIAPGARWPTKRWPVERFAHVAQELARQHHAAVVILGDEHDVPLVGELRRQLSVPTLDCVGHLTLMHTAALLQRCRLLLCNDSGLMHMATALQVPVVAIFGPTVQEFGFYPFRGRAQIVSHTLPCRPCSTKGSRRCPRGHHHCMQRLSGAQVLTAAEQMWEGVPE